MAMNFGVGGANKEVDSLHFGANGVVYEVSEGYIGVGGVNKEFWGSAGGPPVPVTITGKGNLDKCCVTIGDNTYSGSTSGIEVVPGSTMSFRVYGTANVIGNNPAAEIIIGGSTVATAKYKGYADFTWEVPGGISAINIAFSYQTSGKSTITVTTT